jgi:hypothetical protein
MGSRLLEPKSREPEGSCSREAHKVPAKWCALLTERNVNLALPGRRVRAVHMLLREFGTEPLVRVMDEAEDAAHAQAVAQRLADWWQGTWRSEARQPWLLRRDRQNSAATGSGVL